MVSIRLLTIKLVFERDLLQGFMEFEMFTRQGNAKASGGTQPPFPL